jgi:hypothetical protein
MPAFSIDCRRHNGPIVFRSLSDAIERASVQTFENWQHRGASRRPQLDEAPARLLE